jgi:hypothetical protein
VHVDEVNVEIIPGAGGGAGAWAIRIAQDTDGEAFVRETSVIFVIFDLAYAACGR